MRLIEIRDLDGPNVFLLEPAIKIELELDPRDEAEQVISAVGHAVRSLHRRHAAGDVTVSGERLETPDRVAIVFPWSHRRFAVGVAARAVESLIPGMSAPGDDQLAQLLSNPRESDRPLMISDEERQIPVAMITGTNGKTTTTRLLAHILREAGKRVGWCSTTGVYIDGEEVLAGDYSGPAGARRVVTDPSVEIGVLETARGGILLRGLGCQSNDVSIFTNVSADHLNLHGVRTVEGLAKVKAVVCQTTRQDGVAVLNADDPIVVASASTIRAEKLYFSRQVKNQEISRHRAGGGRALVARNGRIELIGRDGGLTLCALADVPMTFGGRAVHMVENAMAAAGAALALGSSAEQVRSGLASFRPSIDQNRGRLNAFDVGGVSVILDYAHNEAGLRALLDFARHLVAADGRITVLIGTAGDRTDASLREIGRIAAAGADRVVAKRTERYMRGRTNEEMISLHREGAALAGTLDIEVAADELSGMRMAVAGSRPGDVVALMCQEQVDDVADELSRLGRPIG